MKIKEKQANKSKSKSHFLLTKTDVSEKKMKNKDDQTIGISQVLESSILIARLIDHQRKKATIKEVIAKKYLSAFCFMEIYYSNPIALSESILSL